MPLNEKQQEAVQHFEGPMMVLAGPGSGKTTVITSRVRYLIQEYQVDPAEILVIAYTKAAATDMKNRFLRISDGNNAVTFGTFHSLFFRILRQALRYSVDDIINEFEKRELIKGIIRQQGLCAGLDWEDEDFYDSVISEISYIKNDLIEIENYFSPNMAQDDFRIIYTDYETAKRKRHKIDFDDMLKDCYTLLSQDPQLLEQIRTRYRYILIDEFQDINRIQFECIRLIAAPLQNLFIVGDDDQCIFRFRGANPEFLLQFPTLFKDAKQVTLTVNYRSTDHIIRLCQKMISQNARRYEKDVQGVSQKTGRVALLKSADIHVESVRIAGMIRKLSEGCKWEDFAIIYRTNIQARAISDALRDANLPYQMKDNVPSLYEHWIVKDICSYIRLALGQHVNADIERIINKPKRYVSKAVLASAKKQGGNLLTTLHKSPAIPFWQQTKIDELIFQLNIIKNRTAYEAISYIRSHVGYDTYICEYAIFRKMSDSGLFEVLDEIQESAKQCPDLMEYLAYVEESVLLSREQKQETKKEGIVLSTMHSAKGLEFDTVFAIGIVEGVLPHQRSKTEEELAEECRLLYVAMTRAKRNLFLSVIQNRYDQKVEPSRFLSVLQSKE